MGEDRTDLEEGSLLPAGILAAHKIMASSPDMDLATVSALRVGAGWTGTGRWSLKGLSHCVWGECVMIALTLRAPGVKVLVRDTVGPPPFPGEESPGP